MNFFLGFLAGSGVFDGLAAVVIAFIPGFIVFCVAKAFLEGLTSSVNNRFIASVVPIVGG